MGLLAGLQTLLRSSSCRTMAVDIGGMRKPYLTKDDCFDFKDLVAQEPFGQFKAWFDEATKNDQIYEANAMCLSTATKDGLPSGRMVLLKK
jgi:pyridoxamine 5'-phosphate oxidase